MSDEYERRPNTAGWRNGRDGLGRVVEEGENLMACEPSGLDDLKLYGNKIDKWVDSARDKIQAIYVNAAVAGKYCAPLGQIDWDNMNHRDIKRQLRETVAERLRGFEELIERTQH